MIAVSRGPRACEGDGGVYQQVLGLPHGERGLPAGHHHKGTHLLLSD